MQQLPDHVLLRAWRHSAEPTRIHYIAVYADHTQRHLYIDEGHPLHAVLASHLLPPADDDTTTHQP